MDPKLLNPQEREGNDKRETGPEGSGEIIVHPVRGECVKDKASTTQLTVVAGGSRAERQKQAHDEGKTLVKATC